MTQLVGSQLSDASSDGYAAPPGVKQTTLVNGKIKLYKTSKQLQYYSTV
jgi:hypothetical protein